MRNLVRLALALCVVATHGEQYALVFDAGSSGTRVTLFRWALPTDSTYQKRSQVYLTGKAWMARPWRSRNSTSAGKRPHLGCFSIMLEYPSEVVALRSAA